MTEVIPDRSAGWTWHQDWQNQYFSDEDVTLLSYVDNSANIKVYEFDHQSESGTEYTVETEFGFNDDDHLSPVIHRLTDDRLLVAAGANASSGQSYWTSDDPMDPLGWSDETELPMRSYPNPIYRGGLDTTFHFGRDDDTEDQYFLRADGLFENRSDRIRFTDVNAERVFLKKIGRPNSDEFYVTISRSNPSSGGTENTFWSALRFDDGDVYSMDGTLIVEESELPLSEADIEPEAVQFGELNGDPDLRVWDLTVNSDDNLCVLSAKMHDTDEHEYYYNEFDGGSWETHHITDAGAGIDTGWEYYSGGLCFNQSDASTVYLSASDTGVYGEHEIHEATTSDGGETWSLNAITEDSEEIQIRPRSIKNANADLPFMWLSGPWSSPTDWDTTAISTLQVESDEPTEMSKFATNSSRRVKLADGRLARIKTID